MSLFHPTPGEIADRMSILELKIAAMEKDGKDTKALQDEHMSCVVGLGKLINGEEVPAELMKELDEVNRIVWDLVDQIHSLYHGDLVLAGSVGIQIAQQNDRRFAIVGEINKSLGWKAEQKVYTQ